MIFDRIITVVFAIVFGIFIGATMESPKHLWGNTDDLMRLNESMKQDKTARLGIVIVTEKSQYVLQSIDKSYKLKAVVEK